MANVHAPEQPKRAALPRVGYAAKTQTRTHRPQTSPRARVRFAKFGPADCEAGISFIFTQKSVAMLTAVKGTYDNGRIIWHETPPVQKRTEVIVTFLEPELTTLRKSRKAGSLAGRGSIPADFNEPLDDLTDYM